MSARARRRLVAALAALTMFAALGALLGARDATAQRPAARVYVLEGDDRASDQAVAQALRTRGFSVTRGVNTHLFDGTQATLSDYDVVVVLYTANWSLPVPAGGLAALRSYVEGGGSLVTGEWFSWRGQLGDLMPTTNCRWNTAPSTTYTQVAPNAQINAGLPISFTFSLGDFAGSESCLEARPEATVFYGSSNGGGADPADGQKVGLAAWNFGQGRVAAFSTLLSATELESAEYRTLFTNTVAWASEVRDASPPSIQQVDLSSAGQLVRSREVTLEVKASDRGGAGMGSVIVAEYVFSGDESDTWRLVATSGWRAYRQPGLTLGWTLSDTPGVHYLRVFAADRAGNVSRDPGVVFISYQPPGPTPIGLDEAHLYRVALPRLPLATARMSVTSGNPDLYVRGPGVLQTPISDEPVEAISFPAEPGVYELGVIGYQAGSYTLELGSAAQAAPGAEGVIRIQRRGRGSVINANPPEPVGGPGDLPPPPADGGVGALEPSVYLPAVQRP